MLRHDKDRELSMDDKDTMIEFLSDETVDSNALLEALVADKLGKPAQLMWLFDSWKEKREAIRRQEEKVALKKLMHDAIDCDDMEGFMKLADRLKALG